MTADALGAGNITAIGVGVIVALVVIGALVSVVVTAILGRIVLLLVVVGLAILVWQQRTHIQNDVNAHTCKLGATFFGVHVDPPASVRQACRA